MHAPVDFREEQVPKFQTNSRYLLDNNQIKGMQERGPFTASGAFPCQVASILRKVASIRFRRAVSIAGLNSSTNETGQ